MDGSDSLVLRGSICVCPGWSSYEEYGLRHRESSSHVSHCVGTIIRDFHRIVGAETRSLQAAGGSACASSPGGLTKDLARRPDPSCCQARSPLSFLLVSLAGERF